MTSGDQVPQSGAEKIADETHAESDAQTDANQTPDAASNHDAAVTPGDAGSAPAEKAGPAPSNAPLESATSNAPLESAPSNAPLESATAPPAGSPNEAATSGPPSAGPSKPRPGTGPLTKLARGSGPLAARGLSGTKPASPKLKPQSAKADGDQAGSKSKKRKPSRGKPSKAGKGERREGDHATSVADSTAPAAAARPTPQSGKVQIPNLRQALPEDIQSQLDAELADADIEAMLGGSAGMPARDEPLSEGDRVHGQVIKMDDDHVFISLGGPDEGAVPRIQFEQLPEVGASLEVIVRGISSEDGLFQLSLPGGMIEVNDWEDLDEGAVVEATVTGSNSGGLECKVGNVRGFIPISQISEYRVEDTSEFVGQKLLCVVTEANAKRGNLVLSRRAILEREREEKRKEQLEKIEVGDQLEGVVRSVKDFGAFVDLGGLDGLIHISKLSWERVKHPSEVLEVGQKVKVKIDSVDKDTGKISLSYRDLLDNPWDMAESEFPVGSVHTGTVSRIAAFGCFVKLAPGVEGLVHISELAHHRVSKVDSVVQEGQSVDVKVLNFDRQAQKIGLSIKAAQQPPADAVAKPSAEEDEAAQPPREPAVKASHEGPLKGGNDRETGGERFGLRW